MLRNPKHRAPVQAGALFLQNRHFRFKSKNRLKNHPSLNPNFDGFWIDFWTRSENIDFVKIVLPPAREHDF